jgi:hypothetical protein
MLTKMLRAASNSGDFPSFISFSTAYVASGSTITVNAPSDNETGDILVAVLNDRDAGSWTNSAGFTDRVDNGICISTKITSGSESATYTFNCSETRDKRIVVARFRDSTYNSISSVDQTSPYVVSQITMLSAGLLLGAIVRNGSAATTFTLPSGMTTIYASGAITVPISFGYEVVSAGATGTRTFTSTDTSSVSAIILGLRS